MVQGVTAGYEKRLEIQGVGYRAQLKGKNLELAVGYSHPVPITAPIVGSSFTRLVKNGILLASTTSSTRSQRYHCWFLLARRLYQSS